MNISYKNWFLINDSEVDKVDNNFVKLHILENLIVMQFEGSNSILRKIGYRLLA